MIREIEGWEIKQKQENKFTFYSFKHLYDWNV